MVKLNLTAANKQEELILAYLQENASETLADKINSGTPFEKDGKSLINKKTLFGFMKYACDEARKLAEKGASSACVDDATVYGWAIHYSDDHIEIMLHYVDTPIKPKPIEYDKDENPEGESLRGSLIYTTKIFVDNDIFKGMNKEILEPTFKETQKMPVLIEIRG